MSIKEIKIYETSDGTGFENEDDAKKHESTLEVSNLLRKIAELHFFDPLASFDSLAIFLIDTEALERLNSLLKEQNKKDSYTKNTVTTSVDWHEAYW